MTESQAVTAATAGEEINEQATDGTKAFEAITSQADFDAAIQSRIARERAKIPTDYEDLKAKAEKYAVWEESQKTESQKVLDRAEAAEKRADELETRTTRAEVAAAKGIPAELLSGSTQEELEKSADALIAFRGEQKQAPSSSAIGRTNGEAASTGTAGDIFAAHVNSQLGR